VDDRQRPAGCLHQLDRVRERTVALFGAVDGDE
jgi:hypothetical protein